MGGPDHMIFPTPPVPPSRRPMLRIFRFAPVFVAAGSLFAQQSRTPAAHAPTAPTLSSADYARWETLGNGSLSPDGQWIAYDFRRGNGSTELHYRPTDSDNDHTGRSAANAQF